MDAFDIHIAQQKIKDRNTHIAIAVFIFVILLLIVLCVLVKHMFDQKEKKKPSDKFDVKEIIPDIGYPFSEK